MSLIVFTSGFGPDSIFIEDDGIPGNATGQVRGLGGTFGTFTFAYPPDALTFQAVAGQTYTIYLFESLAAATLTVGSLTDSSVNPDQIRVRGVQSTAAMTMVATNNIVESGSDFDADIVASSVTLSASTGIGTGGNALETQVSSLEAETTTGGINIRNFGSVTIGGLTPDVSGLFVTTSGNLTLDVLGSITLSDTDGGETIKGGDTSGNVTLNASGFFAGISSTVNQDSITAPGGSITVTAAGNIQFGTGGASFDNDVRARNAVTFNAGGLFWVDGSADIASDDFGANTGGGVTINAAGGILVLNSFGDDASIAAGGTAGANVTLSAGAGNALQLSAPGSAAVSSSSGKVIANVDRAVIDSASGITASGGSITLRPQTDGRPIDLGSASDSAQALELSDTELDRMFAPSLVIGGTNAGAMTVSASITPANAPDVTLQSGTDITVNAGVIVAAFGDLQLKAGDDIFLLGGSGLFGSNFTAFVDFGNTDPGTGGTGLADASYIFQVHFVGNADKDTLTGGVNSDILDGQGGSDTMTGRAGNDTYIVDDSHDLTIEAAGEGTDTIQSSVSWTMQINTENLLLTGSANINGNGNTLANTLTGNSGANTLNGANGDDTLFGGIGNDTLIGGNNNDTLIGGVGNDILNGQSGTDTASYADATAAVTVSLAIAGGQNTGGAGSDTLVGIENLIGSTKSDTLTGDAAVNILSGGLGNDTLVGGDANDTLFGEGGKDTLVGGLGRDTMTGGSENDIFKFNDIAETGVAGSARDIIADFVQGSDKIDLATIDANTLVGGNQAFAFIAAAGFSGVAGQLRSVAGATTTTISGDVNGDSTADFAITLTGVYTLTAGNFTL